MEPQTLDSVSLSFTPRALDMSAQTDPLRLLQHMLQAGARTVQCGECLHIAHLTTTKWQPALLEIDEAILRFRTARSVMQAHGTPMKIFASMVAQRGTFDVMLERAMQYGAFVDVLCFESATPNNSDAIGFAAALKEALPEKQMAFLYAPRPTSAGTKDVNHTLFAVSLRQLGYEYYLYSQFTQGAIPVTPINGAWVLFDDRQACASTSTPNVRDRWRRP